MPQLEVTASRPQRWDVPFGDAMREEDVDRLLQIEPFLGTMPKGVFVISSRSAMSSFSGSWMPVSALRPRPFSH